MQRFFLFLFFLFPFMLSAQVNWNQVVKEIDGEIVVAMSEYIDLSQTVKTTSSIKSNSFRNYDTDSNTKSTNQNRFLNDSSFTTGSVTDCFVKNTSLKTPEIEANYIVLQNVKNLHTTNQNIVKKINQKKLTCITFQNQQFENFILITNLILLFTLLKL